MDEKMKINEKYALVLAGGGAKGCYQLGAWRALREYGIAFNAISGASVGTLNGAIIAQDEPEVAEEIWKTINLDQIVDIPPEFIQNGRLKLNRNTLSRIKELTSAWRGGLGLDTTPLRRMISKYLKEDKIRQSGIDLGVSTVNVTDLKPMEIFLDQMAPGKLGDYLMASASLPLFKNAEIDGKKFLDGALHDNVPFGMLKARGYRRFIVIDISGVGINRRPDITGTSTTYIKNSIDMGGILDFSPLFIRRFTELGYLDTKRVWGAYVGLKYYLIPDAELSKRLRHTGLRLLEDAGVSASELTGHLPREYALWKDPMTAMAECTAAVLGIDRIRGYSFEEFLTAIKEKLRLPLEDYPPAEADFYRSQFGKSRVDLLKGAAYLKDLDKPLPKSALFKRTHPELPSARMFLRILADTGI